MIGPSSPTARHASRIACNWGTPAAVSRRVRQPRPGPVPTLMASAPTSFNKEAAPAPHPPPPSQPTLAVLAHMGPLLVEDDVLLRDQPVDPAPVIHER